MHPTTRSRDLSTRPGPTCWYKPPSEPDDDASRCRAHFAGDVGRPVSTSRRDPGTERPRKSEISISERVKRRKRVFRSFVTMTKSGEAESDAAVVQGALTLPTASD